MKNKRIGIFDSGLGGLTVLEQLIKILPNEDYIFYEDSINSPYGEKSEKELFEISSKIVEYLINNNCKIIVIACNTATTSVMKKLKEKYRGTTFVGTVPAIKVAYDKNCKSTLLLATPYTIKSTRVEELITQFKDNSQNIYLASGEELAHLIDINDTRKIDMLLYKILSPYQKRIDSIVLGCTHYPLVKDKIKKLLPDCMIFDGASGVSKEVKHQLELNNDLSDNTKKGKVTIINNKDESLVTRSYEILKNLQK